MRRGTSWWVAGLAATGLLGAGCDTVAPPNILGGATAETDLGGGQQDGAGGKTDGAAGVEVAQPPDGADGAVPDAALPEDATAEASAPDASPPDAGPADATPPQEVEVAPPGDSESNDSSIICTAVPCPEGSVAYDTDADGCADQCVCASGIQVAPGESCPCAVIIDCIPGYVATDTDADGCDDACVCSPNVPPAGGTPCGCPDLGPCAGGTTAFDTNLDGCPDACLCPDGSAPVGGSCASCPAIKCAAGTNPFDSDADGCVDACVATCAADCDCYLGGLAFPAVCALECATCGNYWLCEEGQCVDHCGAIPADAGKCGDCKEIPSCGANAKPFDQDGDGCPDSCQCLEDGPLDTAGNCPCAYQIGCSEGSYPKDTDGDGCADTCVCPNGGTAGTAASAGGTCCAEWACPWGAWPKDGDGDGCLDTCVCTDGTLATDAGCACPATWVCPAGTTPTDADGDGCPDACACPDGTPVGPSGACCTIAIKCASGTTPSDTDGDGCADACLCLDGTTPPADGQCVCPQILCVEGTEPWDSNGDGCADACVCPDGSAPAWGATCCTFPVSCPEGGKPWDSNGDGCPDACVCPDGSPSIGSGCECPYQILCSAGSWPTDTDGDGCEDSCLCSDGKAPGSNGCSCPIALSCLEGYKPWDTDGDGCADTCLCPNGASPDDAGACCTALACDKGSYGTDTDKDGCADTCLCLDGETPPCCPALDCATGTEPFDGNGDGCADSCYAKCSTVCDCYASGAALPGCPLACAGPPCESYWVCSEAGICKGVACGSTGKEDAECAELACGSDLDCAKGSYCAKKSCDAATGTCAVKPKICTADYDPVCGCDGAEYSNACHAAGAGQNLGTCDQKCGGIAGIPCPKGEYCELPAGSCGWADLYGTCQPQPQVCTKEYEPVCGCNGTTYGNECERAAAGVTKAYDGECKPTTGACKENTDCKDGQYCAQKPGMCAGEGQCAPMPEACTLLYKPVCGCDGKTYSNGCMAGASGASVAYEGECEPSATPCGGFAGFMCQTGQWCEYPEGTCKWADMLGSCMSPVEACPDVWLPVCGCDGKTYGNECERQMAQVSQDHEGECK